MPNRNNRVWEIDFGRGIAILLMVAFHLVVDLKDFYNYNLDYLSGFWFYEGRLSAIMFMLIAGISTALSGNHSRNGLIVLAWGMVITLVTYFYKPEVYIRFGILHLLGSSLLLFRLIKKLRPTALFIAGTLIIAMGQAFYRIDVVNPYWVPLGLTTAAYRSLDHYPLFPWSGVFCYGAAVGRLFYAGKSSLLQCVPADNIINVLGRHSLAVYLLHQPILLAVLYLAHQRLLW